MTKEQCVNYYLSNQNEFLGEEGNEKLTRLIKPLIKEINNDLVVGIDVGSCIGDYAFHISDICFEDSRKILLFEPNPVNIQVLEKRIKDIRNAKLLKHCISDEEGRASIYNWKDSPENQAGNGVAGLRSGGQKICDVDVLRLDQVLEKEIKADDFVIKFLKVDTEGNDTKIIKSLGKYLQKTNYI